MTALVVVTAALVLALFGAREIFHWNGAGGDADIDDPPAQVARIDWGAAVPYLNGRWPGPWECPIDRDTGGLVCTSKSTGNHLRFVVGTGLGSVDVVLVNEDSTSLLERASVPEAELGIWYGEDSDDEPGVAYLRIIRRADAEAAKVLEAASNQVATSDESDKDAWIAALRDEAHRLEAGEWPTQARADISELARKDRALASFLQDPATYAGAQTQADEARAVLDAWDAKIEAGNAVRVDLGLPSIDKPWD